METLILIQKVIIVEEIILGIFGFGIIVFAGISIFLLLFYLGIEYDTPGR